MREVKLPEGIVVGAIVRGDEVIIPRGDTVIEAHDRVIVFAAADAGDLHAPFRPAPRALSDKMDSL